MSGLWFLAFKNPAGDYTYAGGQWSPGWTTHVGHLNGDALADVLLYNPNTGAWFSAINTGSGLDTSNGGEWATNRTALLADFNGDAVHDVITYDVVTGQWRQWFNSGAGSFPGPATDGTWSPGWQLTRGQYNDDAQTDLLLHNPTTGGYFKATSSAGGSGFTFQGGTWSPGWAIYPARFNDDRLTDFLFYNNITGTWFRGIDNGVGGYTFFGSTWSPGWSVDIVDLNNDGISDVFLYDPLTGAWFRGTTQTVTPVVEDARHPASGDFAYAGGSWSPGWNVDRADLNSDGRDDLFLYDPVTGNWFEATNDGGSDFTYAQNSWSPGWGVQTTAAGFSTLPPPPPPPPPGGGPPNRLATVQSVAATNSADLYACSGSNHAFMFAVVRALRATDTRWGLNWKRGVVGDLSEDIVDYYRGAGNGEGSTNVYIIDFIRSCGAAGNGERVQWSDVTGLTAAANTVGRWTCSAGC